VAALGFAAISRLATAIFLFGVVSTTGVFVSSIESLLRLGIVVIVIIIITIV